VIAFCRERLAKFKVPARVIVRSGLPLTRIGKVDRVALRDEVLESHTSESWQ